MSIEGNAGRAAVLYQDSLNNARNAQNSLFAQYGWTMPNSSGGYDTQSTGSAFDPNNLYDKSTGVLNQAKFNEFAGQMRIGGKGILSDVMRGGGSAEADAMAQNAATGTGQGGLANQRRMLAESQTEGQLNAAKSDYLSQFAQANQPIGGAYQGLQTAIVEDKVAKGIADATTTSAAVTPPVTAPVAPVAPVVAPTTVNVTAIVPAAERGKYKKKGIPQGPDVPKNPKPGQPYRGARGVNFVYRPQGPNGPGWYS